MVEKLEEVIDGEFMEQLKSGGTFFCADESQKGEVIEGLLEYLNYICCYDY